MIKHKESSIRIAKIAVAVRMEGLVTMSLGHASAPQAGQDPFVRSLVQKAHTALPAVTSVPVKMVDTVTLSMGSVSVLLVGRLVILFVFVNN